MAEMHLCDHLEELRKVIDQQHLLYLIYYETSEKLEQREKLENCIKEYLYVAPHNQKFTFPQTAQVLHQSISGKENFNGCKAAAAWRAIGKYADNLVVQPWRKEFKDIRLYCGFYKHEVAENLVNAELMFEAMGYCHAGNLTMTITDILDPDRITSVSKDAITAYVECQILKQIWDSLPPYYNFSWLEILEFRENYIGTPRQAARYLIYKRQRRQYEEQAGLYRRMQYHPENHSRSDYVYGCNVGIVNNTHFAGHSYYPVQSRLPLGMNVQPMVSPINIYPPQMHPAYLPQHTLKPQDQYPQPNGFHSHSHSHYAPLLNSPSAPDSYMNYPNYHSGPHDQYSVPTGQLVELDSHQYSDRSQNPPRYPEDLLTSKSRNLDQNDGFSSVKAKDDGTGSWEDWDYVYKNLENLGYKKNVTSRGEINTLKGSHSSRHSTGDQNGKAQTELSDKMRKMNVSSSSASKCETNSKNSIELEDESKSRTGRKASAVSLEIAAEHDKLVTIDRRSPDKTKRMSSGATGVNHTKSGNSRNNNNINDIINIGNSRHKLELESFASKALEDTKTLVNAEPEEKWQCITCTYLNSMNNQICEMCCKSKERGGESIPQPTGGPVCSNCTLVNEPGLNFCNACNEPLKDSPTYI